MANLFWSLSILLRNVSYYFVLKYVIADAETGMLCWVQSLKPSKFKDHLQWIIILDVLEMITSNTERRADPSGRAV